MNRLYSRSSFSDIVLYKSQFSWDLVNCKNAVNPSMRAAAIEETFPW